MTAAQRFVQAARAWVGTRWVHQGRLPGVGVDCVGLVIAAARDAGLVDAAAVDALEREVGGYGRHPDGRLIEFVRRYADPVPLDEIRPGDVLVLRFERDPQHLAIAAAHQGTLTMIHSHARARRVVEHRIDELWRSRIVAAFRPRPA